jgi:hypothetical protein
MVLRIRPVEYFYVTAREELGAAYGLLADLARRGVELLGFAAIPVGPNLQQFTLFPEDPSAFVAECRTAQVRLDGPHRAIFVSGDEGLDALAGVHEQLFTAGIEVYASSGASDSRGAFGYVLYVREDQFEGACGALGCDTPELRAANEWLGPRAAVLDGPRAADRG